MLSRERLKNHWVNYLPLIFGGADAFLPDDGGSLGDNSERIESRHRLGVPQRVQLCLPRRSLLTERQQNFKILSHGNDFFLKSIPFRNSY
jgi:hypothetical protein